MFAGLMALELICYCLCVGQSLLFISFSAFKLLLCNRIVRFGTFSLRLNFFAYYLCDYCYSLFLLEFEGLNIHKSCIFIGFKMFWLLLHLSLFSSF